MKSEHVRNSSQIRWPAASKIISTDSVYLCLFSINKPSYIDIYWDDVANKILQAFFSNSQIPPFFFSATRFSSTATTASATRPAPWRRRTGTPSSPRWRRNSWPRSRRFGQTVGTAGETPVGGKKKNVGWTWTFRPFKVVSLRLSKILGLLRLLSHLMR